MPFLLALNPEAGWVVGMLLKATLLLTLVLALDLLLKRAAAAWRHWVWAAGIAATLLLPILSFALPWRWPVLPLLTPAEQPLNLAWSPAIAPTTGELASLSGQPMAETGIASEATRPTAVATSAPTTASLPWGRLLLIAYLVGVACLVCRIGAGAYLVGRVARGGRAALSTEWQTVLLEAADRLQLGYLPRLVIAGRFPMPFACGIAHPVIVLPEHAEAWSVSRRRAVLRHEVAHLKRGDLLQNLVAQWACALYWFHPLVWLAARRMRIESERACDDLVLGVGTRASEYAGHLLQIAREAGRRHTPAVALPMAQRRAFEGRMLAILEPDARRAPPTRRHTVALTAMGGLFLVPLAVLAPGVPVVPAVEPSPVPEKVLSIAGPAAATPRVRVTPKPAANPRPQVAQPVENVAPDTLQTSIVTALIHALDDSVAAVRTDAAYALGRLAPIAAVGPLNDQLVRDANAEVREMIAWALGQMQPRPLPAGLAEVLDRDQNARVRKMAAWALAQIGDRSALPALVAALSDSAPEVAGTAAWAIGTLRPGTAPAGLVGALDSPDNSVRLRAAWALGRIVDPGTVKPLAARLEDTDREVRHAALWALGRLRGPDADAALVAALKNADPTTREQAARALAGGPGDPWPWPLPLPIIR